MIIVQIVILTITAIITITRMNIYIYIYMYMTQTSLKYSTYYLGRLFAQSIGSFFLRGRSRPKSLIDIEGSTLVAHVLRQLYRRHWEARKTRIHNSMGDRSTIRFRALETRYVYGYFNLFHVISMGISFHKQADLVTRSR